MKDSGEVEEVEKMNRKTIDVEWNQEVALELPFVLSTFAPAFGAVADVFKVTAWILGSPHSLRSAPPQDDEWKGGFRQSQRL